MNPNNQQGEPQNPYKPRPQLPHYVPHPGQAPQPNLIPLPPQQVQPGLQPQPQSGHYDFILNPAPPPKRRLIDTSSLPARIAIVCAGLLVLIILFNIVRGLLSGGNNFDQFVGVAQDQQSLIHLTTNATGDSAAEGGTVLTTAHQNFAWTTKLSLASSQSDILTYLQKNNKKTNPKALSLKISSTTDKQLITAASASTYDKTFEEVMQTQLANYMRDLQNTYAHTKGPNGRTLLEKQYDQASLLKRLLESKTE